MPPTPKLLSTAAVVVLASTATVAIAIAVSPATGATTTGSTSATALFTRNLLGVSRFTQRGSTVTVHGLYRRLTPGRSYFTVVYGNSTCDPAQAFPVGYFTAGRRGTAGLSMTTSTTIPALVAGTMSMSVRMADTAADLDQDGKTGPTDVVAVAGAPAIGLVECNSHPTISTHS